MNRQQGDSLMSPAELHADSIVIDGLIIAKWNRELFEDMRKGGLTAANCTVSVWKASRPLSTTSPPARN